MTGATVAPGSGVAESVIGRAVHVKVPATSANLGPGFDTLGLALGLHLDVEVAEGEAGGAWLEAEGEGAGELPRTRENLLHRAYALAASREGVAAPPVRFRSRSEIPLARGLGSSAAAVVAGLSAFEAVTGHTLSDERLLRYCLAFEGHLDNAAAALFGGFVTACVVPDGAPVVVRRDWPAELRVVVAVPDLRLETSRAREVLPERVSRADAVFNLQRAALFHAAISERRWDLLAEAMRDRLHQPYRAALVPGLAEALALEPDGRLLGVALSGAGSSVVALAAGDTGAVASRLGGCFARHGLPVRTLALEADPRGRQFLST